MQEKLTVQEIEENNVINHWVEKYMDTKKEFDQYKKSKQASYEALQKQCNNLEFENRRIKGDNRILFEKVVEARKDAAEFADRFQRKTAECEELKEWCDTKDSLYQKMTDNFTTSYIEAKRYKQALDEIEDIIAKIDADECCYGDFDCKNCNSDGKCETAAKRTILDIIRKVKGEE